MHLKLSTFSALFVAAVGIGFLSASAHAEQIPPTIDGVDPYCNIPSGPNCPAVTVEGSGLRIQIVETPSGNIEASCSGKLDSPPELQNAAVCDSDDPNPDFPNYCVVIDPSDQDTEKVGIWHATVTPSGQFSLTCKGNEGTE